MRTGDGWDNADAPAVLFKWRQRRRRLEYHAAEHNESAPVRGRFRHPLDLRVLAGSRRARQRRCCWYVFSHTSTRLLQASGADMFRSFADGSANSDGEAAASTAMLTVMPIVVVPCLVGGYWLPKLSLYLFARCCVREEVLIEWDNKQHGEGTVVMLKSDKRRGVSTTDRDGYGEIKVRFDDDGSESGVIKTDDVLAVEAGPLRCACQCSRAKVGVKQTAD